MKWGLEIKFNIQLNYIKKGILGLDKREGETRFGHERDMIYTSCGPIIIIQGIILILVII